MTLSGSRVMDHLIQIGGSSTTHPTLSAAVGGSLWLITRRTARTATMGSADFKVTAPGSLLRSLRSRSHLREHQRNGSVAVAEPDQAAGEGL